MMMVPETATSQSAISRVTTMPTIRGTPSSCWVSATSSVRRIEQIIVALITSRCTFDRVSNKINGKYNTHTSIAGGANTSTTNTAAIQITTAATSHVARCRVMKEFTV